MRHHKLIESTHREAVIESCNDLQLETVKTTVHLPVWIRREAAIIAIDEKVPQGKWFTGSINHGTTLLQELIRDQVNDLQTPIRTLSASRNPYVVEFIQNFGLSVNGLSGAQRRTILVPAWCKGYLGKVGGYYRIDYSSLLRLTMYLSIQRYDNILSEDKVVCDKEIKKFVTNTRHFTDMCKRLTANEPTKTRGD